MKSRLRLHVLLAGAALILPAVLLMHFSRPEAEPRPVTLRIVGAAGQRFTGSYTVDGAVHVVNASAPAAIRLRTTHVTYDIRPDSPGPEEFRVNLFVGQAIRVSTLSYQGQSVRGGYHLTDHSEAVW